MLRHVRPAYPNRRPRLGRTLRRRAATTGRTTPIDVLITLFGASTLELLSFGSDGWGPVLLIGLRNSLIIAFGDSLYAGYQLGPKEGLAPQLQAQLLADGISARVQNAGVSGDTTAAGRQRLSFVLDHAKTKPALVLLGLGGNDMLRGIGPGQTRANLDAMLAELRKRDIPVLLTGMVAAPNLGADYAKAFDPIYPELAAKYDASLYPFILDNVVTDKSLMLGDNMHPNAKGVKIVAASLAPLVEQALPTPR